MADFVPTTAQKAAIEARNGALLVSAGAGSGKTKVLTERLMSYITDPDKPADLDSFLIITFTRAAAGELRGRITEELASRLALDPSSKRLRRQSALCQRAQIETIHGFCSGVLREFSHIIGISPDFKIADDERAAAMKQAALERVMEKRYADSDKDGGFFRLADTVGAGRDDKRLCELVLNLHSRMQCHARPKLWAEAQVRLLNSGVDDIGKTPWGAEVLERAESVARYWAFELDRLMQSMARYEKISAAYMPAFSGDGDAVRELVRCIPLGWDRAREAVPTAFTRLGGLRQSPDPDFSDALKRRRDAFKKDMQSLADMMYSDSSTLMAQMKLTQPAMEALLNLTLEFDAEFDREKRRCALVDYSDLEHLTAQLLTDEGGRPTELAERLSLRYTEIMVDEYQDVSRVQDTIFHAISRNGTNLFMVGDVKQSIYRFRLADPAIFTEKYLSYTDYEHAAPGEERRVLLRENFRSRREILDAANSVFSLCMSRELGDIDYDDSAALRCGADYPATVPVPELLLLSIPKSDGDEETPDKSVLEASLVAREIQKLIDSGAEVTDHGVQRPMEYGDIALLLRSANTVGPIYRRTLAEFGIPVASGQGGGFFTSTEISVMMSMLAIIDNPHQDIPLIAVLRSPAFGFSADELSAIRAAEPKKDFYSALCKAAEENEKCRRFLARLISLRDTAADMEAGELVWTLINTLDMPAICSAMTDGEQRRANLFELIGLAERFDGTGYRGLHRFVLWLRRQAEKGLEPSMGTETASAVQIMSVHKSKGLEFPVVFLCDTARRFNKQDGSETVLVHPILGLGPKVTDLERKVEYPTLARSAIRLRLERELLSEEMRLLYVAMTRPKERLFITAALKKPEELIEKCSSCVTVPMSPAVLAGASAPVNWLIYSCLADKEAHIKMRICDTGVKAEDEQAPCAKPEADAAILRELASNLSYRYPHEYAPSLPSKVTATELKGRYEPDSEAQSALPARRRPFRMPDFTRVNKPLTGTERGTATHLVLQYMNFERGDSLESIQNEIVRLREKRFISDREAQAVDAKAIYGLFTSPLGKRMREADTLIREFKFSLLEDAQELFAISEGDEVLMQGVVDCCLEEDGELVIIDYKTDAVKDDAQISQRAEVYRGQLTAYAAALRRIFEKPVKECILYFLSAGKAVILPPD